MENGFDPLLARKGGIAATATNQRLAARSAFFFRSRWRVYVATSTGIAGFSIDPNTGNLSPINAAAIVMANINGIYIEPSGNFLYITTNPQGSTGGVYGYSIAADGSLAPLGSNPLVLSMQPTSMAFKSIVR